MPPSKLRIRFESEPRSLSAVPSRPVHAGSRLSGMPEKATVEVADTGW